MTAGYIGFHPFLLPSVWMEPWPGVEEWVDWWWVEGGASAQVIVQVTLRCSQGWEQLLGCRESCHVFFYAKKKMHHDFADDTGVQKSMLLTTWVVVWLVTCCTYRVSTFSLACFTSSPPNLYFMRCLLLEVGWVRGFPLWLSGPQTYMSVEVTCDTCALRAALFQ